MLWIIIVLLGGECSPGYYCPSGSAKPQLCPGGFYCEGWRNFYYTGMCNKGYYCSGGSSTATPSDGIVGGKCPAGHYCPVGTMHPIACPVGTFSNGTGNFLGYPTSFG